MLDKSAAWTEIANAWRNPTDTKGEFVKVNIRGRMTYGLCTCVKILLANNVISKETAEEMLAQLDAISVNFPLHEKEGYFWPTTIEGAMNRHKTALRFATDVGALSDQENLLIREFRKFIRNELYIPGKMTAFTVYRDLSGHVGDMGHAIGDKNYRQNFMLSSLTASRE